MFEVAASFFFFFLKRWVSKHKNYLTRASLLTSCIRVMPAVAVTVLDGSDVIWSGRLVRVDESDKLKDILRKLVPEEDVQRLEKVQSAVSDSSARYDADGDDEVGVHLEFGRRYVYFRLGMRRRQRESYFLILIK